MESGVTYYRKSVGDDIENQRFICQRYAKANGIKIEHEYIDESMSRVGFKSRKGYMQLLADIRSGKLKGYYILVRDQDRLTGEPGEMSEWQLATAVARVRTYSARDGREIKDDYFTDQRAVVAKEEVRQTRERVTGWWEQRNAAGTPPNARVRPFGFTKGYKALVPEERDLLLKVRDKVFAGVRLYSICRWLNEQGSTTTMGKPWTVATLSALLRRWEYAGWRGVEGERVAKGSWKTVWSVADQERLLEILGNNSPFAKDKARKHLLSGILVCSNCGSRLRHYKPKPNMAAYACKAENCARKSSVNAKAVEDYLLRRVYEEIKLLPEAHEEVDTTDDDIQALNTERAKTVQARKDGEISLHDMAELVADLDAKVKELQAKQRNAPMPVDSAAQFLSEETDVDVKRATIKRFYPIIGLKSAGRRGEMFTPARLEFPDEKGGK